jgi:uncharacterized protein (TIGR02145 family)
MIKKRLLRRNLMRSLKKLALAAAFGLAFTFTFGCLEDNDSGKIQGCPNAAISNNILHCGGQNYKTVTIGKQVWMAQNLNYDVPGNYTDLCYSNVSANCAKYGRLYNWATAMALPTECNSSPSDDKKCVIKTPYHRGICPEGWHIPSAEDLSVLLRFEENLLKAKTGWNNYEYDPCECMYDCIEGCKAKKVMKSGNGTDDYGFAALPGGGGYQYGGKLDFLGVGFSGNWWSATGGGSSAYVMNFRSEIGGERGEGYEDTNSLFSVRCLRDALAP